MIFLSLCRLLVRKGSLFVCFRASGLEVRYMQISSREVPWETGLSDATAGNRDSEGESQVSTLNRQINAPQRGDDIRAGLTRQQ